MPHPQKEHHGINMGGFQDDYEEQYQRCGMWSHLMKSNNKISREVSRECIS